jgi:hypothetical protein
MSDTLEYFVEEDGSCIRWTIPEGQEDKVVQALVSLLGQPDTVGP